MAARRRQPGPARLELRIRNAEAAVAELRAYEPCRDRYRAVIAAAQHAAQMQSEVENRGGRVPAALQARRRAVVDKLLAAESSFELSCVVPGAARLAGGKRRKRRG